GSPWDGVETGQELADIAVPLMADYAVVDLAGSVPFGEEPSARIDTAHDPPPVLRRAGLASIHPGIPESPWARGETVFISPDSPFTSVLRTGRSHLEQVLDTSAGTWLDHDPTPARTI